MNKKSSKILKGFAPLVGGVALFSSAALVACGDDSSSSGVFSMEESFEMVLAKADYSYNKKDSTLKKILPVCKQGTLGNLVGPDDTDEWDTVSYKAYENKGIVSLQEEGEKTVKYSLEDGSFLKGFWTDPDYTDQRIQKGFRYKGNQVNTVIRYDGTCLMKDFYSLFRKDAPAIRNMDSTLVSFYSRFLAEGDTVNEKTMLADIRATDCDELTLFDGLVRLNVEKFKASSGNIKVSYAKRTCNVSFQIRYAYDQKDCAAAFEDFQNDGSAKKDFRFNDYAFDVIYDDDDKKNCLDYLILDLKTEKGIPTKKKISSYEFAHDIINLMTGGMK